MEEHNFVRGGLGRAVCDCGGGELCHRDESWSDISGRVLCSLLVDRADGSGSGAFTFRHRQCCEDSGAVLCGQASFDDKLARIRVPMPADLKMFGRFAFAGFIVGCFTQTCGETIDLGCGRLASEPNHLLFV